VRVVLAVYGGRRSKERSGSSPLKWIGKVIIARFRGENAGNLEHVE
jgi:hypothetical protein